MLPGLDPLEVKPSTRGRPGRACSALGLAHGVFHASFSNMWVLQLLLHMHVHRLAYSSYCFRRNRGRGDPPGLPAWAVARVVRGRPACKAQTLPTLQTLPLLLLPGFGPTWSRLTARCLSVSRLKCLHTLSLA